MTSLLVFILLSSKFESLLSLFLLFLGMYFSKYSEGGLKAKVEVGKNFGIATP